MFKPLWNRSVKVMIQYRLVSVHAKTIRHSALKVLNQRLKIHTRETQLKTQLDQMELEGVEAVIVGPHRDLHP